MMVRQSLLFLPVLAFAQQAAQQPPPGVEAELRARVSAFYQNFVDGSPRRAEAFVAEDTKDFYYGAQKLHYESFKVGKVTFSDGFTKAMVLVVGKLEQRIAAETVLMDRPQETHWKLEGGKWCWTYHSEDYNLTPMSEGRNPPPATGGDPRPKDLTPEAIRAAGQELLKNQGTEGTVGLDTSVVTMRTDQVSTAQVVFLNGSYGYAQLGLNGPIVRGLTAKWDKMGVPGHDKAVLTLRYDPSDKSGPNDAWTAKGQIEFQVVIMPFERVFPFTVTFSPAQ
jgi:hypothetical protein